MLFVHNVDATKPLPGTSQTEAAERASLGNLPATLGGSTFEYLYLVEVVKLSRTCTRMNQCAREAFSRRRPYAVVPSPMYPWGVRVAAGVFVRRIGGLCERIREFRNLDGTPYEFLVGAESTRKWEANIDALLGNPCADYVETLCVDNRCGEDHVLDDLTHMFHTRSHGFPRLKRLLVMSEDIELFTEPSHYSLAAWSDVDMEITFCMEAMSLDLRSSVQIRALRGMSMLKKVEIRFGRHVIDNFAYEILASLGENLPEQCKSFSFVCKCVKNKADAESAILHCEGNLMDRFDMVEEVRREIGKRRAAGAYNLHQNV